jgi:hypothetical protein
MTMAQKLALGQEIQSQETEAQSWKAETGKLESEAGS